MPVTARIYEKDEINTRCETYTWEYSDEGGGTLSTVFSLSSDDKIRSVELVVPNDSTNYEFRGDFDGILKKICR